MGRAVLLVAVLPWATWSATAAELTDVGGRMIGSMVTGQLRAAWEAVDLGEPFRGGGLGAPLVTTDATCGRLILNFEGGGEFVRADLETGELLGRWELGSGCNEFGFLEAPDTRLYLPLWDGRVKRFDPRTSEMEDLGEPIPGDIIYCAVWHPDQNCLYGGTVGRGPVADGSGRVWRYDPATGEYTDLGPPWEGERVWSMTVLPDGRLLCGVAPHARLVTVDPRSGETTDVWPDHLPAQQWLYDMALGGDGLLYVTCSPGPELVVFDAQSLEYVGRLSAAPDLIPAGTYWKMSFLEAWQGRVFGLLRPWGELVELSWDRGMRRIAEIGPHKMYDFTTTPDGRCVFLRQSEAVYHVADPGSGETWTGQLEFEGRGAAALKGVWRGPDGRFYLAAGGMQRLLRTAGQPGDFERLGEAADSGGQPECMLAHDGRLWIFSYPYAWLSIYDPAEPWNAGREPGSNPWQPLTLGHDQNRPHQTCLGPDGLIYVTTTSAYGLRGGALSRVDPESLEVQAERLETQVPWGLAADGRYVYCGTGIRDESDLPPLEAEAAILVWDPEREEFVDDYRPVPGARLYQFLSRAGADDRLLFGATASGTLFGYNLDTAAVDCLDDTLEGDDGRIGSLIPAPGGGAFYVTSRGRLLLWAYGEGRLEELAATEHDWVHSLVADADGSLLAVARTHLLRLR